MHITSRDSCSLQASQAWTPRSPSAVAVDADVEHTSVASKERAGGANIRGVVAFGV